jgi:hypothetical protein
MSWRVPTSGVRCVRIAPSEPCWPDPCASSSMNHDALHSSVFFFDAQLLISYTPSHNLFSSWFASSPCHLVSTATNLFQSSQPASQQHDRQTDTHKNNKRNELSSGSRQVAVVGWPGQGAHVMCAWEHPCGAGGRGGHRHRHAPKGSDHASPLRRQRQCTPAVIDVPSGRRAPAGQPPVQQPFGLGGGGGVPPGTITHAWRATINNNNTPI